MSQLKNAIDKIVKGEEIKNKLKYFYKSTLDEFIKFIKLNNFINLN